MLGSFKSISLVWYRFLFGMPLLYSLIRKFCFIFGLSIFGGSYTRPVVDGMMEVLVDGRWKALSKGEGLRFNADQAHGYRNYQPS